METVLKDGITWVGQVDWSVRDFHGYVTRAGSTYNAYLVRDKKTALIDTVKAPFAANLLANITKELDPAQVDYVVCNHAEPDHSGGLPAVLSACVNAELVCDKKCADALSRHYDTIGWKLKIVADGDSLSLGNRSLTFMETPMVHWPESMFTYIPEEQVLFSMDAFGQHYASAHRFDDQNELDKVMAEAKTYYANIVMLYGSPIKRVLERAQGLDIQMIAPSHGVIWRKHLAEIMSAYQDWVAGRLAPKVLVIYDTMWKSTERMAHAIIEGALESDVEVSLLNVRADHITDVATESLDAAAIAVGSPTLNGTLMPGIAAALTYLKGLRPSRKAGFAFGSYGWGKGGAGDVEGYLKAMKFEIMRDPIQSQFVPNEETISACREAGRMMAKVALERSSG